MFGFIKGEQNECMLSNNSMQPEWRANYKGDYKYTTRPVCTHDLLCWAFQVARGMDYLASRKVRMVVMMSHLIFEYLNTILPVMCIFGKGSGCSLGHQV
jgi:FMS-like tyrosine kinase 1